jgi:hypothetical protein
MTVVDPSRYRETLVTSLTNDGLEDLTHRLVLPNYPGACRTGPGRDGGIDVLSDLGTPPARGWQAKNYPRGDVSWTE